MAEQIRYLQSYDQTSGLIIEWTADI
jgi:hypothetical protein